MKTLVIHLADPSTNFLKEIYLGKTWDIINHDLYTNEQLKTIISEYDRIVMLGHGSPMGLFSNNGYLIDDSFSELLKTKECVCIWCNADLYFKRHKLKGFYSGMFISEVIEAEYYNILDSSEKMVNNSNQLFAKLMGKYIFTNNCLEKIKNKYRLAWNSICLFNSKRLYKSK